MQTNNRTSKPELLQRQRPANGAGVVGNLVWKGCLVELNGSALVATGACDG